MITFAIYNNVYYDISTDRSRKVDAYTSVLNIDDMESLKQIKRLLHRLSSKDKSSEDELSKEKILSEFNVAAKDMNLARKGELKGRPLENILNEL